MLVSSTISINFPFIFCFSTAFHLTDHDCVSPFYHNYVNKDDYNNNNDNNHYHYGGVYDWIGLDCFWPGSFSLMALIDF